LDLGFAWERPVESLEAFQVVKELESWTIADSELAKGAVVGAAAKEAVVGAVKEGAVAKEAECQRGLT